MQPLPHLESCLRVSYDARDERHPCGISLASYFVRARTRGRRRSGVEAEALFPPVLHDRLGRNASRAIPLAMDPSKWRVDGSPRATVPVATREWLAEAAQGLGNAEGYQLVWVLLRATSELEGVAQRLLGSRLPRATVRQVLHGVDARTLRVEPFAAFLVRVLKIAQAVYAAFREAGHAHEAAWEAVQDRLWSPHPTGRRNRNGGEALGAYLPSLVQAASGNARRRLRKNVEAHRTVDHARALLARFASSPAAPLWPWTDAAGRVLPPGDEAVSPEMVGIAFFALLTLTASERRSRGGPSGGLSRPYADAGFGASEWLPDRTDDLAVRLLVAGAEHSVPDGERLETLSALVRATLGDRSAIPSFERVGIAASEAEAMLGRARARLPDLLVWLEQNGRELLERT
jgi:hypothetical protein